MKIHINEFPKEHDPVVAIDIELFEAEKIHLHRPHTGRFASLQIATNDEDVYVYTDEKYVMKALHSVKDAVWVFHNAKFDITHLRRWDTIRPRKKLWDTMLMEMILYSGYYVRFSLKDLARRYLKIVMDKEARDAFTDATKLTDEMIEYAAKDALITLQVYKEQKKKVKKVHYKTWVEIERPFLWAVLDMQGVRIDVDAWETLAVKQKALGDEITSKLKFNPRSTQETQEALKALGWTRLSNSRAKTLERYIQKDQDSKAARVAKAVLAARQAYKRSSTYGMKMLDRFVENDLIYSVPIILGDWKTIGTETFRTACQKPNLQNIPARSEGDIEYRRCFKARPGHKLVIADFGQQEPRITAYLSEDANLILAFKSGDDVYCYSAKFMYGEVIDKGDKRRKTMKDLVLGMSYGLTANGLADRQGISVEDAQDVIDSFFKAFPGIKDYVEKQHKKIDVVHTVMGTPVHINRYSSQANNNRLNAPIQATAGQMMKMSINVVHRWWRDKFGEDGLPFMWVLNVHDEVVFDVPEKIAKPFAKLLKRIMIRSAEEMCPGIPFDADVVVADTWAAGKEG